MTKNAATGLLGLLVAGCSTIGSPQVVKVAVPVPCQAAIPARPGMPTDALRPGDPLDRWVQLAAAEIERREGYEGELRAALEGCVAPLPVQTPALP